MLKGKKIVLGITGSIAAYNACLIIRELIKAGAEVQVVITPAGKEFITPITLSALTHKPVISEFFSQRDGTWNSHVDLGLWADAMLIAPCTASTLGKMANGVADNMLITTYLSMKAPVFIAPAMDLDMYQHPTTQENLRKLQSFGNRIIEAKSGFLASGLEGKGRMEEPEEIVAYYYEEGEREGIRPDVAFCQALKETGFFRYGGDVIPEQNNFCGLGTTGGGVKGEFFATPQLGVRAHIQHLLAYSSTRRPTMPVVDPRYSIVRQAYGSRTLGTWQDLNGRWAVPGRYYGQEILSMFHDILVQ